MATEYSGGGDAKRGLDLLWGRGERPTRGPKASMSLDQIVRTAMAIADAEGLEALSMRKVAAVLGYTPMSLYRYVPSKGELIDLMLEAVMGDATDLSEVKGGWREKLRASAVGDWDLYHQHPWMLQISWVRPPLGPRMLAAVNSVLAVTAEAGFSMRDGAQVLFTLDHFTRGAARMSIDSLLAEQRTGISDEAWWAERYPFLREVIESGRYPAFTRAIAEGAYDAPPPGESFTFGLERILDGVALLLPSAKPKRSGKTPP
ncbi:MAG: TetR/AcrR family transcriptional regulator [Bauldia sp.]